MEKLERQLGLLAALLHTERPLVAAEIRNTVDGYPDGQVAFRRAFERDKDDLRRLGIPLHVVRTETSEGSMDGYRVLRNDYYLHDLGLEADEIVALAMALRLIRLEGAAGEDALWKLGGASTEVPEVAAISMGPAIAAIHEAIAAEATVSFSYREAPRSVEPLRLAFRRGYWYLQGWDRDRADTRTFRVDRIDGSIAVGDPGSADSGVDQHPGDRDPWQFGSDDEPVYRARVAIDSDHAEWAQHRLGADSVVARHADGSIEIELDVSNVAGFRSLIISMSSAAEVLEPPELREDLIAWLTAQLAMT